MPEPRSAPVTVPTVRAAKRRDGHAPLVMVTAYDAPGARIADAAGVDIILVGDSVANNVLGYEDTLQVTVDDMVHHTAAVARARPGALVVADLPWLSYHLDPADTVRNAATLIRAGAQAVKLEGGRKRVPMIEALVDAEIPVMGHLGLTPQSVHAMGGYRVQGRGRRGRPQALAPTPRPWPPPAASPWSSRGCPTKVGAAVTEALEVPTIGIGAGPDCDGQVLVFHDLLGLEHGPAPKFVRRYAELADAATAAVAAYAADVRVGCLPGRRRGVPLSGGRARPVCTGPSGARWPRAGRPVGRQQSDLPHVVGLGPHLPDPEGGKPPMRPYETMVIFDTGADEAAVNGVLDRALGPSRPKAGTRGGSSAGAVGPSPTSSSTSARATTSSSS